jgi:anti-sigma factor RsiW
MYRNDEGQRLTLYVSNEPVAAAQSDDGAAFRFAREGPINVFYWVDHGFGYAISAQADRSILSKVSTEVYAQLATSRP